MMKRLIFSVSMLALAVVLNAVPAKRGVFTVLQPDGTELGIQRHGDEIFHYTTTEDDYLIAKNAAGVYEYAQVGSDNVIAPSGVKARSVNERTAADVAVLDKMQKGVSFENSKSPRAKSSKMKAQPTKVGSLNIAPRGLVILANYSDKSFVNKRVEIDSMLNGVNYTTNGATGSSRQYFRDQSNGAYNPVFDVVGPVSLPKNMKYYGGNNANGDDLLPGDLIIHACSIANAQYNVNFSLYDNDSDGYVDFVYVIYAGKGEADSDVDNTIWPHNWDLESAIYYGNATAKSLPEYDGKKVNNYACSGELNGRSGNISGIGTFTHEFSHVLGLPDYYDTDYGTNYENNATPGEWTLMDQGSYNNDGRTPPNYSAHDKYFLGWATPTIMNVAENVALPADGQTYRVLTNGTLSPTSTSSVYYFENRQNTGWDAYLPGHGMLVTKVMYSQSVWSNNGPNNGTPMRYDIVEADGKSTGGDAGDTYPGTSNKTTYTPIAGAPLTNIAETSGVVSFLFKGGVKCVVTFNAGENGTCATLSLTEAEIASGVTLPAAVGNAGYVFVGWATAPDTQKADAGVAGATYKPSKNATLYAVYKNENEITVTYNLHGVNKESGADHVFMKGNSFTATFRALDCYNTLASVNTLVEVKVGGTVKSSDCTFSEGVLTVSLGAADVTDNLSISVSATSNPSVTFDLDFAVAEGNDCAANGKTYTAIVTPNSDYLLGASDFLITMGGADLDAADFTYEGTTLTIPNVTGDLVIVAIAKKETCSNYEYIFSSAVSTGALQLGDYDWTFSATNSNYLGYNSTKGAQLGSGSNPTEKASFTTSYTNSCAVSKVSVSASVASSGDGKLSVYLGGEQVGTTKQLTTTDTNYDFALPSPKRGALEIRFTNTVKAMYIQSINVVYGTTSALASPTEQNGDILVVSEKDAIWLKRLPLGADLRVIDLSGQIIRYKENASDEQQFVLPKGFYIVQIIKDNHIQTIKAISK